MMLLAAMAIDEKNLSGSTTHPAGKILKSRNRSTTSTMFPTPSDAILTTATAPEW
ncbi:MAG: hypothetical protein FWD53_08040 [Phycisphaerales bacterium]|nr:hypothetical protein [Phycisphaerales bacterium]